MLTTLIDDKFAEFEIQTIFNHLDKSRNGYIPKEKFLDWFSDAEQEKIFTIGIDDIIKPLVTYMNENKMSAHELYERYD